MEIEFIRVFRVQVINGLGLGFQGLRFKRGSGNEDEEKKWRTKWKPR